MVKESQEKAHVEPEASAIPEEVQEKAAVENELLEKAVSTKLQQDLGIICPCHAPLVSVATRACAVVGLF